MSITFDDIQRAARLIESYVHRTPVVTSAYFDKLTSARVFFKCENLQKVGAFKFRGATNSVQFLSVIDAKYGVVTNSSGNHAQAIALAALQRNIPAVVVMPEDSVPQKRQAVLDYGATVISCAPTLAAREQTASAVMRERGAAFVHPYDDPRVIAGQGTAALELVEQAPDLDLLLGPVGGGGLMSGTALTIAGARPGMRVIGVEPAGADDAARSLAQGARITEHTPHTVADGLRTCLSATTFAILAAHLEAILTVTDAEIGQAMRTVMERMKLVIEPSAAVPVALLMSRRLELRGLRVGVILSGGNANLDALPWA